jgi:hypothetical protein
MLNVFLLISFSAFIIMGYSLLFKRIIFKSHTYFANLDLVFGLISLSILSIFINFFSPLKYFQLVILILGFIFFLFFLVKGYFKKFNFFLFLFYIFILIFISYSHGINSDSPLYHLQIIKWITNEKIIFGLSNLETRYSMNSIWHSLLSIFNFEINKFNLIYLINIIPYALLLNELTLKSNRDFKRISSLFLLFSILIILFFSLIHPFINGIIINHLGSPEVDMMAMIFFIISGYLYLRLHEEQKNLNINIILLISSSLFCLLIKISYMTVIIFPVSFYLYSKPKFILRRLLLIILSLLIFIWVLRSYFISGCLVFPVAITCYKLSWSLSYDEVVYFSNLVKSFARDTPDRLKFNDFEFTLNSFQWLSPWFNQYFLKTGIIKINLLMLILSLPLILVAKINKTFKVYNFFLIFILVLFFGFFLWMQAPEVRFGHGYIISLGSIILSYSLFMNIDLLNKYLKYIKYIFFLFLLLLFTKNINNFHKFNENYLRNFDYNNFTKIYEVNSFEVFYPGDGQNCTFFQGFCTYNNKIRLNIHKKNGYFFITKNS